MKLAQGNGFPNETIAIIKARGFWDHTIAITGVKGKRHKIYFGEEDHESSHMYCNFCGDCLSLQRSDGSGTFCCGCGERS